MGICRDMDGRLAYTLTNKNKDVFSVTEGDNRICKHLPYMVCNPCIYHDKGLWDEINKPFPTFISAVQFLKTNQDILK